MTVDYIIIGQGLCGSWLSYYMMKAGKKVFVIDEAATYSSTKVASGIINPVTGRRIVRTWRIEELLPFALDAYTRLGAALDTNIVTQTSVLDFHPTLQMQDAFNSRLPVETEYLHSYDDEQRWKSFFNFHYSIGEVAPCLLIDLHNLLDGWRSKLKEADALVEEPFNWADCTINDDHVVYRNYNAEKIFCCEGVAGFTNPYFKNLPYSHMKGEALIVSIPGLPTTHIYKHGLSIVPWQGGLFWVGSSYEWKFEHLQSTTLFRQRCEAFLQQFVKLPYSIVDHIAADRPANMERRPFVGLHPRHPAVGILNGMGTKGCSLAPLFANQLVQHLVDNSPLYADADVARFAGALNRSMN